MCLVHTPYMFDYLVTTMSPQIVLLLILAWANFNDIIPGQELTTTVCQSGKILSLHLNISGVFLKLPSLRVFIVFYLFHNAIWLIFNKSHLEIVGTIRCNCIHKWQWITISIVFWRIWNLFHEKCVLDETQTHHFHTIVCCPPLYPLAPWRK